MAFGVIGAVSGIGVPGDRPIGCDLERWAALLVQILAVLGFNRGWIDRVFGESEPSRCHEGYRGNHEPVPVQSIVLGRSMTDVPARGATPRAGTFFWSAHCGSANTVRLPPSAV